jgi:hypothetical protein
MTEREMESLVEATVSAYRERDGEGRIPPSPAWWDLPPEAREEAFSRQWVARAIERAVDPEAWSGTVRAVMARLR